MRAAVDLKIGHIWLYRLRIARTCSCFRSKAILSCGSFGEARCKMEKTASTSAIVKGSTSTSAEVIAVDVDEEALCCPRCLHPLVPPVFQVCIFFFSIKSRYVST
jgi:hypothetical protein